MLFRSCFVVMCLFVSQSVMAQVVELGLRNSSFSFRYTTSLGIDKIQAPNKIDSSFSYNEDQFNEMLSAVGSVGFQIIGTPNNTKSLDFSVGGKFIYAVGSVILPADTNKTTRTGYGLGLGGEVNYYPEFIRQIGLVGEFFYAPPILTFGNANAFQWVSAQVDYYLIENAQVFVGFRSILMRDNSLGGDFDMDLGPFAGLKMVF